MGVYVLGILVYCVLVCVHECVLGWVLVPMVYGWYNEILSMGAANINSDRYTY